MKLEIPDADRELLRKWLLGSNEQTDRILDALEHEEPALQYAVLMRRIAAAAKLDEQSVRELIAAFFNLSNTVATFEPTTKEHAAEIVFNSVVDQPTPEEHRTVFEARIDRILKAKSIE